MVGVVWRINTWLQCSVLSFPQLYRLTEGHFTEASTLEEPIASLLKILLNVNKFVSRLKRFSGCSDDLSLYCSCRSFNCPLHCLIYEQSVKVICRSASAPRRSPVDRWSSHWSLVFGNHDHLPIQMASFRPSWQTF